MLLALLFSYFTDAEHGVLYPFGFGLSYSSFGYSAPVVKSTSRPCDSVSVSAKVRNSGGVAADEVVQLYMTIHNASVPVPIKQLVSFARIHLSPGQERTVTFTVAPEDNAVMRDPDFVQIVESGRRQLWIGGSSDARVSPGVTASFEISNGSGNASVVLSKCARKGRRALYSAVGVADAASWSPPRTVLPLKHDDSGGG